MIFGLVSLVFFFLLAGFGADEEVLLVSLSPQPDKIVAVAIKNTNLMSIMKTRKFDSNIQITITNFPETVN